MMSGGTSSIQTFKFSERIALLASEWAVWLPVRLTWLKQMLENRRTKALTDGQSQEQIPLLFLLPLLPPVRLLRGAELARTLMP